VRRQPISKGFSTGLKIWLLFLIGLFGMGYPALLSISLGAIGGLASSLIVDWWLSKDEKTEPDKKDLPEDGLAEETKARRRRSQYSSLRQRSQKRKQQPEKAWKWWQQMGRRS
jgi:hypothetical protein